MNATQQPLSINVNVQGFVPADVILHPISSTVASAPESKKVVVVDAELHRTHLQDFLVKQVGRFIGVDFIKVDGSGRSLNGRLGVKKHLKGGDSTLAGADRPYLVVYDVKSKGYRAVNLATVSMVRAQHARYAIIG